MPKLNFGCTVELDVEVEAKVTPGCAGDSGMGSGGQVRYPTPAEDPEADILSVKLGGVEILGALSDEQIEMLEELALEQEEAYG